jgi:hypothetical protein
MGKSLREKIKEQPLENQIKIENRAKELIALELARQEKRQLKLTDGKQKRPKRRVVIFGKIHDSAEEVQNISRRQPTKLIT